MINLYERNNLEKHERNIAIIVVILFYSYFIVWTDGLLRYSV